MRPAAKTFLVVLLAAWAGIVIGISLISTPVKFQAPLLTMAAGLDVGHYTFRLLSRIELCLALVAIIALFVARARRPVGAVLALAVALVLVERYWLLPILDARVTRILAGESVAPSVDHTIFAAMEVLKVALLLTAAAIECRALR